MSAKERGRYFTIDILRCIGLFLVIAAHCEFPQWFIEFREFDVVLLVFVSGASFFLSKHNNEETYGQYVLRRFKRLVLPVWVFLTIFFLFFFLCGRRFSVSEIIQSYLLLNSGVLFVWVYRVFFTTALLNPFCKEMIYKYKPLIITAIGYLILLINDLFSFWVKMSFSIQIGKVFQYIVTYTVAYAVMSLMGMVWVKMQKRERLVFLAVSFIVFTVSGLILHFPSFYELKYPPTLYYTSYGLFWCLLLGLLFDNVHAEGFAEKAISWISINTMNIYLWHIVFYYLLDTFAPDLLNHGILSLIIFVGGGILCTMLQNRIKSLAGGAHE